MGRLGLAGIAALGLAGCTATIDPSRIPFDSAEHRPAAERALARWTTHRLIAFEDQQAFRAYLRDLRSAARARGEWWAFTRADADQDDGGGTIYVTGSRIPPRNASITNVQDAGVDEGDIVKQIDRFLLILQDGRVFVVDTGAAPGAPLALTDRANVYRDAGSDMWYDEMLVHGDRVVVAGYSYDEEVAELAVFRLSPEGRLRSEGVFHIAANDYYDSRNYATRLVDGNLLIYTPLDLTYLELDENVRWPAVHRVRTGDTGGRTSRGRPLIGAEEIYRPLINSFAPTIHTVSICPLTDEASGRNLECRSTALLGPEDMRYYVSNRAAYVWLLPRIEDEAHLIEADACSTGRPAPEDNVRGVLYRIPHDGTDPGVVAVRGVYFDHFAIQEREGSFRALVQDGSVRCNYQALAELPPVHFTFFTTPVSAFGPTLRDADANGYTPLPGLPVEHGRVVDRFTDDYLIYGPLGSSRYYAELDEPLASPMVAVPVRRPQDAQLLTVPHSVIRAEQAGEDIVLTGYRGPSPLQLSLIDLSGRPRVASTYGFDGRYESEGRSHAFNSIIEPDGSGLIGIPTVVRPADSDRHVWRSRASDLSFLAVSSQGELTGIGELERRFAYVDYYNRTTRVEDRDGIPGYECEVSCVDWYGNSRPIFTDGRIFALSGTELIEGQISRGRIQEVQRLNIALESVRQREAER